MKKTACIIIILLFTIISIYSQDFSLSNLSYDKRYSNLGNIQKAFTFHRNNRITGYKNGNLSGNAYSGSYKLSIEHNIHFLLITWDDKSTDRYLAIYRATEIYLYNSNSKPFFSGTTVGYIPSIPHVNTNILSATSFLKEGNINFSTDNLDERIGVCWVEGVSGNGIGEKIIISNKKKLKDILMFNCLYISIGFVSFDKPHLYTSNSRPKRIRVSLEGENPKVTELLDTPNLQSLDTSWWPDSYETEKDLWIEILEVYHGTRFEDTSINFFVWDFIQ